MAIRAVVAEGRREKSELSSRTFCTFAREFSPFTVSLAPPAGPDLTCRDVDRVLGHYAGRGPALLGSQDSHGIDATGSHGGYVAGKHCNGD